MQATKQWIIRRNSVLLLPALQFGFRLDGKRMTCLNHNQWPSSAGGPPE